MQNFSLKKQCVCVCVCVRTLQVKLLAVQCFDTGMLLLMWCGVGSGVKGHFVRKWTPNLFGDEKMVIIYL